MKETTAINPAVVSISLMTESKRCDEFLVFALG